MGKRKAGCVPVRRTPEGPWEVMVVQSRWTPAIWLFPKGGVEVDEKAKAAAVRETTEEAGVTGALGPKLGTWRFAKDAGQKHKMWLLVVDDVYDSSDSRWKERKKRKRQWVSIHECRTLIGDGLQDQTLRRPELMEMLDKAVGAMSAIDAGQKVGEEEVESD